MPDIQQLWTCIEETRQDIDPLCRQAMTEAAEKYGVAHNWFVLTAVRAMAPEPFTAQRFHDIYPYTALLGNWLKELAEGGFLEVVAQNTYRINERGQEILKGIFHPGYKSMKATKLFPLSEMRRLNNLLFRVVQAVLNAPEPRIKLAFTVSRACDPGESWGEMVKTEQYLRDLAFFRDDAHVAAWKPYGVSGRTWETLSFIWEDQAHTAQELADMLFLYRAYTQEDYAQSLAELVKLGWVEPRAKGYQITEKGCALRQEAEHATNRYHFAPWNSLNSEEQVQVHELLRQLRDKLQSLAKAQPQ